MASSSLGRKLAVAVFAAMVALGASADAQEPLKVLFLGHSMTRHGVAPKIGWTNDWGMAASAREKDYAHLVARGIEAKRGRKVEMRIRNIYMFERKLADFDMAGQFAEDRAWNADYTVIFIGENSSVPKTPEEKALFRTKMQELYRMFAPTNGGDMVVTSVFSPCMVKAQLQREAAKDAGVKYVKLWDLGVSKECKAIGKFWHPGVAGHPGDKGMALIAERVLDAFFPPPALPIAWRGERLADWWKNEDIAEMHVEGNSLKGLVTGRDAQLHVKLAQPLEPKGNRFFTFRMKAPRGGNGQLFWIHRGAKGPSETFQKTFWVIGDGKWHDYKIRPGWCGPEKISILRFDFPSTFAGGTPFELADIAVVEEGDEIDFLAQDALGVAFSLKAPPGINYYALEWSGSESASGALHFSTPPDGKEHAYWFDLANAKTRGNKSWAGRIMNFAVRQPFANRELKVENFRFLKERPSLPPDPVITSAIPSEAVPRAGRPFVVEAVVRNFGTLPAEHLRFSFDGLPDGVKPLDAAALAPAELLPGSNGAESLNHDCGPQLPHERVFKFLLSDLGAGKHVFGLSVSADGVAPRRIEVVADVKPSLNLPRLDYPAEPKPVDTAPYTIGALMFPGWVNHKWHAVWSHDHARKPVLGWYDEESPETVDWQIKYLVENGISFVSVCWYWRNGVPSRNHWMKAFRQARYRKYLKWHVMWDNGYNSLADQEKLAHYWCTNCFNDVQYHRIDGKPVVAICSPAGMEQRTKNEGGAKRLLERTREIARSYGFPGVYFVAMRGMGMDYEDPAFLKQFADYGFDVTTVYGFRGGIPGSTEFDSRQRTFKNLADMSPPHWRALLKNGTLPFWPSISTGYDDRPWRGERVLEIRGYNVADFARICREARKFGDESGTRTFLLGPLDEWGEGSLGYPNHAQGFGILESVREAFGKKPEGGWPVNYAPEDVGLVCPQNSEAPAACAVEPPSPLSAITSLKISNCEITQAEVDKESGIASVDYVLRPGTGSFIRCSLVLPPASKWTGRFRGFGNGGAAGNVRRFTAVAQAGDAAAHTDMGSSRGMTTDDAVLDFGYRSTHLMTVTAKAMTEAYYGRKIRHSYFQGKSTGGGQAIHEAERYPEDYDGILAGVPANTRLPLHIYFFWNWRQMHDDHRTFLFSHEEFAAAEKAAFDWFADKSPPFARGKFILDPRWTPEAEAGVLACAAKRCPSLGTPDKQARLRNMFRGPVIGGRHIHSGIPFGASFMAAQGNQWMLYWWQALRGKSEIEDTTDADLLAMEKAWAPAFNACSGNLSAFFARGGKLLVYGGLEDSVVPYPEMIAWYERAAQQAGGRDKLAENCRLYLIPGRAHGSGKYVKGLVDEQQLLTDWVENGKRPEEVPLETRKGVAPFSIRPYPACFAP